MSNVEVAEGAQERYRECITAIFEAQNWVDQAADEQELIERRAQLYSMERSFLSNAARLLFETNSHDGRLYITTDSAPLSFFWRYESGYHGGLIFHPIYVNGTERLPVGTWSIHT